MTNVDRENLAAMTADEVIIALEQTEDLEFLDDLAAAERDGENRISVLQAIEARTIELQGGEVDAEPLPEDAVYEDAPVDEILPIIRVGDWARIKGNATKVPAYARGRDVSIVTAVVRRAGNNTITSTNHEYQLLTDAFNVKLRDTGEEFECTRAAFAAFGPDRGKLTEQAVAAAA